ncbi:Cys-tRNA(Pro) deacylase [Arthrobacter sp. zg-Y820]|uniref:Cys-tRNA(Pro) deacylase n=1 Tax=unclassified Arthrobacter TaxID=235627 RepID=UPI001E618247|nr:MULTISPECIES: Cys-tRNA(Pro) deacylase [unclassified Arthrobacter]MCC9197721.1 Cys-tRNA(Pro) deacylase [Arthrobacter sp. zg-Y820]MDK1280588.1 Cys-tRNA(Pro) deacylase [Arthrobacter sp. zg.Y820]MDK1361070.1 Cys-tRNA(Pro) deacylase [Arthrobacter sp. zg-Y1219]WIB10776.1 Cys-tRNA(Pro) deacylase [Arthrobacter sp. zg-Y820]
MAGRGKTSGSATPATRVLDAAKVPYETLSYTHDHDAPSYGLEAADKLGLPPESVYKTLMVDLGGRLAVAMVPVAYNLDLKKFAALMGARKASMAHRAEAERRTGYVVGGISPLGQRHPSAAGIDSSAELLDTIYVSGGRRGFQIGLSPFDLIRLTSALSAPIAGPKS